MEEVSSHLVSPRSHETLTQMCALVCRSLPYLREEMGSSLTTFSLTARDLSKGVLAVTGTLTASSVIHLRFEIARIPKGAAALRQPYEFFKELGALDEPTNLAQIQHEPRLDYVPLRVEVKTHATPLTPAREAVLLGEIERIALLADKLQEKIPVPLAQGDLEKVYGKYKKLVHPVYPLDLAGEAPSEECVEWARQVLGFLAGSISVAIASPFPVINEFGLALLAGHASEFGWTLARLLGAAQGPRELAILAGEVPGLLSVSAPQLTMGVNPYERSSTVENMLATLSRANTPVMFNGTLEQLQAVFQGGQGDTHSPLTPAVVHAPVPPMEQLSHFAVREACRRVGGASDKQIAALRQCTLEALGVLNHADQKRLLPILAARTVNLWAQGKAPKKASSEAYLASVGSLQETLSGLSDKPRTARAETIQARLVEALTDSDLLEYFKKELLCQDRALEELVMRLRAECLTRPPHQPLRYCCQGTPGCGKSESAFMLAQRLEVPFVNIDAASMPDHHTATSQLLGSGRGVVNSDRCGRLEEAAKHYRGAVIEVSDLDHAPPSVRATLADIFLQVLETGEAQSAVGNMFSCANLILVFTMNLPGGADESVRKQLGFISNLSHRDVQRNVVKEIKEMLSSAFLSRVGMPILFDPLDGVALATIVTRAIVDAVERGCANLEIRPATIAIDDDVGPRVVASSEVDIATFGARSLFEHSRSLASEALLESQKQHVELNGRDLRIALAEAGGLRILSQTSCDAQG